jgi:hypothetical protein
MARHYDEKTNKNKQKQTKLVWDLWVIHYLLQVGHEPSVGFERVSIKPQFETSKLFISPAIICSLSRCFGRCLSGGSFTL